MFAALLTLSSCGGSSVRRNEDGASGTSGNSGTSGASGTSGTSGRETCERELPNVDCDWRAALGDPRPGMSVAGYCAKGGCHNPSTHAGALDLTPDTFLASRLLNVPAKHASLSCPGLVECDPAAATCERCSACPPDALLIDTSDPESSWMLQSIEPFIPGVTTQTISIGCGDAMPTFNTTGTQSYHQGHKDCLRMFFLALAETPGDWPCVPN